MKNRGLNIIDLGDFTGERYTLANGLTFKFCSIDEVLNYIKTNYNNYDVVLFSFRGSNYKLEFLYKLTAQKII